MDKRLELGIQILDAMDSGDLELLDSIFQNEDRDVMEITESEHWNWLHKALLGFDADRPPVNIINYLIGKGVDVNAQDIYGMAPLHYALRSKNAEAAIALLKAGANPNLPNRDNLIPLRMAIAFPERLDMLELMLKNGGNVHYFNGKDYLLEAIKAFKGNDPDPKYAKFIHKLEEYA